MARVYDRQKNEIVSENGFGQKQLKWAYETLLGRVLLKLVFARRWYSKLRGLYDKSIFSKSKIKTLVYEYGIEMAEYEEREYGSFYEWFVRKHKKTARPFSPEKRDLSSVADAKVFHTKLNGKRISVKQGSYFVEELIQGSETFENGDCLVYRLGMEDCHRYNHFDDGELVRKTQIKGNLHTVRPISKEYHVFAKNSREVSIINTNNFGQVAVIEVGALLAGEIYNHSYTPVKGDEKGFFGLGGSAIVVLFKEGAVQIDDDIKEKSYQGIETKVYMGEKVGHA